MSNWIKKYAKLFEDEALEQPVPGVDSMNAANSLKLKDDRSDVSIASVDGKKADLDADMSDTVGNRKQKMVVKSPKKSGELKTKNMKVVTEDEDADMDYVTISPEFLGAVIKAAIEANLVDEDVDTVVKALAGMEGPLTNTDSEELMDVLMTMTGEGESDDGETVLMDDGEESELTESVLGITPVYQVGHRHKMRARNSNGLTQELLDDLRRRAGILKG